MDNITKDRNYFQSSMGDFGFRRIAAGETSPGGETYRVIVCLQEASINAESMTGDSLTGQVLPTGMQVFGKFTQVSCYQGVVLAYLG
tara:strand:- start:900 stop:1160 length:261 start_codon:yes stop_codon:yes gene_type:complete